MAMKIRKACCAGILATLIAPGFAAAQKVERLEFPQPGEKFSYNLVINNKAQAVEDTWTASTDTEALGVRKSGGKEFEIAVTKTPLVLQKAQCISNGQACTFSPGVTLLELPLEKGKQWTTAFTAKGETFTSEVTQERKVEKIEKVKVPAGEFEAFKIAVSGRFTGIDPKGNRYSGKEEVTEWVAMVGGKALYVKVAYRNSFGEKATQELVSMSSK
jgi:hypothetical protein